MSEPGGVWAAGRRRLTAGLVLTVTLVAFESLAISTVMPVVADDLGGLRLYGWVFSGFFLGSLMGIVVAGQLADERGTRLPFLIGLSCFAVGLAVGATAGSMGVLVAGRVAQGFGAGAIPAVAYVSVGRAYPADAQPRVFAVFSTAWVIPALVGPAAASGLAEAWSWRAVFGALLPLVGLAAAMTVPALTTSRPAEGDAGAGSAAPPIRDRRLDALVLVAGAAAVLAGLGAGTPVIGAALVVGGAIPAVRAFIRLVPPGTLRVIAGLPAAVAVRGLLTFAFFGADAYVSLTLTEVRHTSTWMAGIPLTTASLAWAGGAWVQQREIAVRGPQWLVRRGFLLVALGIGGMLVVLHPVPVGAAVLAWSVAGLGMGLSFAPLSVTVLGLSEPGQEGASSSSLQLSDVLGVSLGTGLSGVFVALGEGRGWAVGSSLTLAFVVMLAVALVGAWAAGRLPRGLSGAAGHGDRTAEHRLSA